jgi:hypothetical protein
LSIPICRIPIPQYPLYTATLASQEAVALNYYLNEEKNWAYDEDSVLKALEQAKKDNVPVKAVSLAFAPQPFIGRIPKLTSLALSRCLSSL